MKEGQFSELMIDLRLAVLKMIYQAGSGYLGDSLSMLDLLAMLYFGEIRGHPVLNYDPKNPGSDKQDYVVLSKMEATAAWYAVLARAGFFKKEELAYFKKPGALLQNQAGIKVPGVVAPQGSAGMGLSIAVGLALTLKKNKMNNLVYCLLGDNELQEGMVFEAAMSAGHFRLDNLMVIVEKNGVQGDGETLGIMNVDPMVDKFKAFGFRVFRLLNGHDKEEVLGAISKAWLVEKQPAVIIAPTIKGKGISFAENRVSYHEVELSKIEYDEAIRGMGK